MLLDETDHHTLRRQGRFLTAAFKRPHRVLSTCRVNGGLREDLTHIANHQSCEGVGHAARHHSIVGLGPDAGHVAACTEADLPTARRRLSLLVGRDTDHLPRDGIVRATIESLSENLTDGVLTPLWALGLFGLPGLIAVKAVSSLDSMVGYKNDRYRRFGWTAARSDDLVHWLPARLSVPLIALAAALLRLHPHLVWPTARHYHALLASPNSGWSEAAFAGALRVRLIGPIDYGGERVTEAFMGDPDWPADLGGADLRRALRLVLVLVCGLLALAVGLALAPLRVAMP